MTKQHLTFKVLYGIVFVIILPIVLFFWADVTSGYVSITAISSRPLGVSALVLGILFMFSGTYALKVYGSGLPMNAFPPKNYVTKGIYKLFSHPIYIGFCISVAGMSIYSGSASGIWLVTPITILGCISLVLGYEKQDLKERFQSSIVLPLISLPDNSISPAKMRDRLSIVFLVFLPWAVIYEIFVHIGPPPDGFTVFLPFEENLLVHEWTEIIYLSTYLFVFLAPLTAKRKNDLRSFALSGLIATAVVSLIFFLIPVIAPPRDFTPISILGSILNWERGLDSPAAAFPSFHVIWAFIAANLYAKSVPKQGYFFYSWAIFISASCITTGMHATMDVLAGLLLYGLIIKRITIWTFVLRQTEFIANSWKEWRIGSVRLINHGFFAGIGAFTGLMLVGMLVNPASGITIVVVVVLSLIAGDLFAQIVEGSSKLLRPFGYYGTLFAGVILIVIAASLTSSSFWDLLAAFMISGSLAQGIGRIRCLIQGCCHGRPSLSELTGIRHWNSNSRVVNLAKLGNQYLYPTPLYSLIFNVLLSAFLLRMWIMSSPLSLISGLYFILAGLARFVEESYRGEPQTPLVGGLHIYQWMSISSIVFGIVLTTFHSPNASAMVTWNWNYILPSLIGAVIVTMFMGIDFPESRRRFARLTS